MNWGIFLQTATEVGDIGSLDAQVMQDLLTAFFALLIFFFVVAILAWVYVSIAFMAIAKRTRTQGGGLAWIPLVGKPIVAAKIARKSAWPVLLLVAGTIIANASSFLGEDIALYFLLGGAAMNLVSGIFFLTWHWSMYEQVGRPGWWVLLTLIPMFGIIIYPILLGVAAWGTPHAHARRQPMASAHRAY